MLKVGKKASFLVTYGSDCVVLFKQSYLIEINIYIYIYSTITPGTGL